MSTVSNPARQVAALLLAVCTAIAQSQQMPAPSPGSASSTPSAPAASSPTPAKQPTTNERRRAAKLYLEAAKLYADQQFEQALRKDEEAAKLDPTNRDYELAAQVARSHAADALVQEAARDRIRGDQAAARTAIEHAAAIDPQNPIVAEHLRELADEAGRQFTQEPRQPSPNLGAPEELAPQPGLHSFHLRASQRQVIQQVFRAYGLEATLDESVRASVVRIDLDNVAFAEAMHALLLLTDSFYVPIDSHRALVARDTRELRQQFTRNALETLPLYGMTQNEMTDISNVAKNVFEMQTAAVDASAAKMTLRAPEKTLDAFNATYRDLAEGRGEVLIDVDLIQLAHITGRETGLQPPQTITAFNVYTEGQKILNDNQSLVQEIISSGLAAPGDTLKIIAILIASGQVSNSLLTNGVALFGGGLTLSGLSFSPATAKLSLNSSDSRELDQFRLRLKDGEEGTLKSGTRYPIQTSSFSSLGTNSSNIPGLTGAGTSSSLSSISASTTGSTVSNIPMVQYEDLGLTLKATPRILRSGDVALTVDMKIAALAGQSINDVPILANRSYSSVITVKQDSAVVIASEVDNQESRAISGYPGISEIPGLNNVSDKNASRNTSDLLIILTPRVVRMPHGPGHSPMIPVDKGQLNR